MSDVGYIEPDDSEICTITYTLTRFNKQASTVVDLVFTIDKATPPTFNEGEEVVDGTISSYKGDAKVVVIPSEITTSSGETVPVTTIGKESFQSNDAIQEITIPDSVTTIEQDAFRWCDNLKIVYLGKNVGVEDVVYNPTLDENGVSQTDYPTMFGCCYNLEQIIVDPENPYLKSGPDNKSLLTKDGKILLVGTKYLDIPAGVETIAQSAFYGQYYALDGINTITIPDTVTEIGGHAFYNVGYYNENPVDVVLSSALTKLGEGAFRKANIKSVEFNSVVADIPAQAFAD